MKLEDISPAAWLTSNEIKTETGKPYDLKDHFFWFDILCDMHPKQVVLKSAQVGGSILFNLKMLWVAKKKGMNVLYTMPTAGDVKDFVSGKTNPLIANNPVIQAWMNPEEKDSTEMKAIGKNKLYFKGTWTDRAALSFSSDLNIYDEVDRSKRSVVDQFSSRLQHSDYQWEWFLSNPSVSGNGVDVYWQRSDKKHWINTCEHCGQKQYLSFPESVNFDTQIYQCKKCKKELSDATRAKGYWHAMAEGEYSGYWVNLMMASWIPASFLLEKYYTKSPEYFYNFVLGLPFESSGGKITEDELFANLSQEPYDVEGEFVIGVDTGLPIWYVIAGRNGLYKWAQCDNYEPLRQLLKDNPKAILVSDQGGDLIGIRELQEEFPGRVFLAYYRHSRSTLSIVEWGKGNEAGKVVIDRNRLIQLVQDELKAKRIPLRGTRGDWQMLSTHFKNIYRIVSEDGAGNERFVWERSGHDHLVHALVYARAGLDMFGMSTETSVNPAFELPKTSGSFYTDPVTGIASLTNPSKPRDWRDV